MPKGRKTGSKSIDNIIDSHRAVYEQIAYLKKRIHLLEGERKATYEFNEEALKKNEKELKKLRETKQELKSTIKQLATTKDNYFKEISEKIGKTKAYAFRDKNYAETIDMIECKVGDLKNRLNLMKFRKQELEPKLRSVENEGKLLEEQLTKPKKEKPVDPREAKMKEVETQIAAMEMKITEAQNITTRYNGMIELLHIENKNANTEVTTMQTKISREQVEIRRMQTVLEEAIKAKNISKKALSRVEQTTMEEYSEREQQLFTSRLQLKAIREKSEYLGGKLTYPKFHLIHRDSSTDDFHSSQQYLNLMMRPSQQLERSEHQILESAYTQLITLTGENSPEAIVQKFTEQRENAEYLAAREAQVKSQVRKSKLHKRFLEDKLVQLQYSGGLHREKLNTQKDKLDTQIETTGTEHIELKENMEKLLEVMENIWGKLKGFCDIYEISGPTKGEGISESEIADRWEQVKPPLTAIKTISLLNGILQKIQQMFEDQSPSLDNLMSPMLRSIAASPTSGIAPLIISSGNLMNLTSLASGSSEPVEDKPPLSPDIDKSQKQANLLPQVLVSSPTGSKPGIWLQDEGDGDKLDLLQKSKDSSDEDEPVTRNVVKRQSQILFDAKTRKGRYSAQGVGSRPRKY